VTLEDLDIADNQLTGSIPSLEGTRLWNLYVSNNQLSGPIPPVDGLVLQYLWAANNALTGPIPKISAQTELRFVDVSNNHMSGPLPAPPPSLVTGNSKICGNSFFSSGDPAIDSAWVKATGIDWITCQSPAPPECTLVASPRSIFAGASSTLTADCNPPASSYAWSTAGCSSNSASCTVNPGATTTYSVAGLNAAGTGGSASASVTVTPATFGGTVGFTTLRTTTTAGRLSPLALTVRRIGAGPSAPQVTVRFSCVAAATPGGTSYVPGFDPANPGQLTFGVLTDTATISVSVPEFPAGTTGASITCTLTSPQPTDVVLDAPSHVITVVPPVFPMSVTANITPARADVVATIQPRPQDVGGQANVYVFALAPATLIHGALSKEAIPGWMAEGSLRDTPVACVLAQLNLSGQLQAVTAASLQAYTSGVLSAQGQSVSVLAATPTPNVAGATFFVGYGASASEMIGNGTNRSVVIIPGDLSCKPEAPQTGWWWNTSQGGRGYSIEVQGAHLFFASYLYDFTGRATWLVTSGNTSLDGSLFSGRLETYANGQVLAGPYKSPDPATIGGDITLAFSDRTHATLLWPGGGLSIERFNIVPNGLTLNPQPRQPESGWWWNPQESGRGFFLEWQGGQLFMAGYMYDSAGNPIWYLSSNATPLTSLSAYGGTWWQYANGQTLTGPYQAPSLIDNSVAPITIQFQGLETGLITLPGGRTSAIQRFRF
jgi:hypothetical protein